MRDTVFGLRGERAMLRRENAELKRRAARMRAVIFHELDCSVCRIAVCAQREKLLREALGRAWLTLRVPE